MKICKKFLKTVFAVLLAFGLMTNTYHASDGEATITITRGNDVTTSLQGMKVDAYMILDQVNPDETVVSKKQYAVVENFKNFFNIEEIKQLLDGTEGNVYLTYDETEAELKVSTDSATGSIAISKAELDTTYPEADLLSRISNMNSEASTFYTWVEKFIEKNSADLTIQATETATENGTTLNNLNEGYYALIFSNVPAGVVVKQGIMIPTSGTSASIPLKAEPITVEKKVSKDENNFYDEISAAMNSTLTYQITTKVPTLADFSNLTEFDLTDTMTHQKLDADSFTLTLKTSTNTTNCIKEGDEFKVNGTLIATVKDITDTSFTVDFVEDALKDYQGQDVVLTYTAQLTSDAIDVNNNTVTLNYTNGPDTHELTDSTKVYTYGIDVTKKFSDGSTSTENYAAVKFSLYTDNNGTKESKILLTGSDGIYHVPASGETGSITDLSIDTSDGTLRITGLDAGTYWLVETDAPDGFTKAGDIKITLVADDTVDGALDTTNSKVETALNVDFTHSVGSIALAQFEVLNQKGFNLPTTGGAGTMMITLGGMALIVVAAGLYVVSKKKKA